MEMVIGLVLFIGLLIYGFFAKATGIFYAVWCAGILIYLLMYLKSRYSQKLDSHHSEKKYKPKKHNVIGYFLVVATFELVFFYLLFFMTPSGTLLAKVSVFSVILVVGGVLVWLKWRIAKQLFGKKH